MLSELYIENLAVIEKTTVRFAQGLTVLSGETGAGKSILIDAINLVLGQRSNRDLVRTGAEKALVCAVFEPISAGVEQLLEQYGYEGENGQLLIQREISADGRSSARIMGRPATLSVLREIGSLLVSIHGQHDNQILLAEDRHLEILDDYAQGDLPMEDYRKAYHNYLQLTKEYKKLLAQQKDWEARRSQMSEIVQQIGDLHLTAEDEIHLEEQVKLGRSAQKLKQRLQTAILALQGDGEQSGALELLGIAQNQMESLKEYGASFQNLFQRLESLYLEEDEIAQRMGMLSEKLDFDEEQQQAMEDRLAAIHHCEKRYGRDIPGLMELLGEAQTGLEQVESGHQVQNKLLVEIGKAKQELVEQGRRLSLCRKIAASRFADQVAKELAFLDMPNVTLKVLQKDGKYTSRGKDELVFAFSTNPGEEPKSISKIASGGELSRIMLAMKNVLAEHDQVQTLIFDEIDTGVSGSSAQKIGIKLKQAARTRQVLCVTHSAQIVALSHHSLLVQKQTKDGRTFTRVLPLNRTQKINEVARIMSTGLVSKLLLSNAEEMVKRGEEIT
ncbi:MAG TPA: DNA repair protein RecN [Candidatus Egerieicola faecale]|uniref:DNA repair protein RecN n=1 Tax=Candidatus Egerieicola faecale TaxID=2840774 RepID=A0A9D1ISL4_9FIRM|nr:DNA repair protein RecN [Candidatus Egerieicola faecale]